MGARQKGIDPLLLSIVRHPRLTLTNGPRLKKQGFKEDRLSRSEKWAICWKIDVMILFELSVYGIAAFAAALAPRAQLLRNASLRSIGMPTAFKHRGTRPSRPPIPDNSRPSGHGPSCFSWRKCLRRIRITCASPLLAPCRHSGADSQSRRRKAFREPDLTRRL